MKKILICINIIFIICQLSLSKNRVHGAKEKDIKLHDNSTVALRIPGRQELDRIRNNKDFQYEKKLVTGNTAADILSRWFDRLNRHFFSRIFSKEAQPFWRVFPFIIMAAALAIVVIALRRGDFFGLFLRKKASTGELSYYTEENIYEIDFDVMIKKFMENNEYRMALRYRFLKSLRNLSEKGVIVWKNEKTNRDYAKELSLQPVRSSFSELVNIFEYVWYGNFEIDKNFLDRMNERFRSFDLSVQAGVPRE